jgi:hypothetical protein
MGNERFYKKVLFLIAVESIYGVGEGEYAQQSIMIRADVR